MIKKCKKIIYFLDFPFCVGGSNKVLLTQAYIMQKRGYQVKIIIPNDEEGNHAKEYDRICDQFMLESMTAYYKVSTCPEEIDIIGALNEYHVILEFLKENKPDLIHSTQLNIAVELAARELTIPHLMNIYQADRQAFYVKWLRIYPQYHSADTVMMSERWRDGLEIASKCIRGSYNCSVKNVLVSRDNEENMEISILSIGVLCRHKNQFECLKFISICKENGYSVKLLIFGDSQSLYGEQCKKYVEENELWSSVQFIDFASNLEEYYKRADLLVVASKVESYPSVVIASMANKVPVLATPVAGVPELLGDEVNGFLTDGYEAKDLYEAFLRYIAYRKSGKLLQLIENAYHTYLEHHTEEMVGNELERYYQWIVNDFYNRNTSYLTATQVKKEMDMFMSDRGIDITQIQHDRLWLIYHVFPIIEQKDNKKVLIWGAGLWGKTIYEWIDLLKCQIDFVGFVDSFKEGEYLGFPIVNKENILVKESGTIIVAILNETIRLEIMDYLDAHGKERNIDYFLVFNGPLRL